MHETKNMGRAINHDGFISNPIIQPYVVAAYKKLWIPTVIRPTYWIIHTAKYLTSRSPFTGSSIKVKICPRGRTQDAGIYSGYAF